jgi:hypothetical protein
MRQKEVGERRAHAWAVLRGAPAQACRCRACLPSAIRRRATWPRVSGDKQRRTGWRPDKPGATYSGIGGAA